VLKAEKKRVYFSRLEIAATLARILVSGRAEIVLHVFLFALLTLLVRAAMASRELIILLVASRRLLAALAIIALVLLARTYILLARTTHVGVAVVVPHSIVCHLAYTSRCFDG
jgi:hypothetical protein